MENTKSVFVTIVGKPNVGKSTLLNGLIGEHIAITSSKPQTTRTKIQGILTKGAVQYVFTDTPGIHKRINKLSEYMNKAVEEAVYGVDVSVVVMNPYGEPNEKEVGIIKELCNGRSEVILVINKCDTIKDKGDILKRIDQLKGLGDFDEIIPVSALKGEGLDLLLSAIEKRAKESPHFFPDDSLTDQPERVLAAEMVREQVLRLMHDEVPHGVAVSIERLSERDDSDILDIDAVIYCERESHKGIVIGKGGRMLKEIGKRSRERLESFFEIKVNLKTWVKVREDWRNRDNYINNFGLK